MVRLIGVCLLSATLLWACKPKQVVVVTPVDEKPVLSAYVPDSASAIIEIETSKGTMKAELFCNTPEHKENFLKHANDQYYDEQLFHRVINGFMLQTGDPQSRGAAPGKQLGTGGPNYTLQAEFRKENAHVKGALAAARTGDGVNPMKESSGSQFYIVHGRTCSNALLDQMERTKGIVYTKRQRDEYRVIGGAPQLDMEYTVFGRVYEGLEVIDSIAAATTDRYDRPKEDIWIKVRVIKE